MKSIAQWTIILCALLLNAQERLWEPVYLHLNKTILAPGEPLSIKAYALDPLTGGSLTRDRNLFLRVADRNRQTVFSRVLNYSHGYATDSFELPDSLATGTYWLEASFEYSNALPAPNPFRQPVALISPTTGNTPLDSYTVNLKQPRLLSGFPATLEVSFMRNGRQEPCVVSLKNQADEVILSRRLMPDKKNLLLFTPEAQQRYHLEYRNTDTVITRKLSPVFTKGAGIQLRYLPQSAELRASVSYSGLSPGLTCTIQVLSRTDSLQHSVTLEEKRGTKNLSFGADEIPSGPLVVQLLHQNKILASADILLEKDLNLSPLRFTSSSGGLDSITLHFKPTEKAWNNGNFSVAVYPEFSRNRWNAVSLKEAFYTDPYLVEDRFNPAFFQYRTSYIYGFPVGITLDRAFPGSSLTLISDENALFLNRELKQEKQFDLGWLPLYRNSRLHFNVYRSDDKKLKQPLVFATFPQTDFVWPGKEVKAKPPAFTYYDPSEQGIFRNDQAIELEGVEVSANRLRYRTFLRGAYEGRKIDSSLQGYNTLEQLLRSYGIVKTYIQPTAFSLPWRDGEVYVRYSGGRFLFPSIIVDGRYYKDPSVVLQTPVDAIDELYYRRRNRNDGGEFRIFTKKDWTPENPSSQSKSVVSQTGFDRPSVYEMPAYTDVYGSFFRNFGLLHWDPLMFVENKNPLEISFPHFGYRDFRVVIHGTDEKGRFWFFDDVIRIKDEPER